MYEWLKAIHILSVVAWMAGLFYLPRLFVYHADAGTGSSLDATFKIMERRLLKAIMRPAALAVAVSGIGVMHAAGFSGTEPWLVAKLAGVFLMFGFHGVLEFYARRFAGGFRDRPARYFRLINEIPTLLLIWIVIFVVVKPYS